ncbi:hypothetical protein LOTGIDRAFT_124433 [Lottia gigantea]|uniref:Glutathione transferase n=1 Tax=Lottia gigantea TaxID=225164 RepID=V3ZFG9_LOTGI|nr:hypothetical protein LOTGIDRAFT_124433 [Lottia gigantea]ESO89883.1 hypothetical protein LOTGIDRAFT_124433 [Lottia gigantea]
MPKYKLVYFDLRGRAELSRLCFAAAGVVFDDVRVPVTKWLEIKPTTPYGELPYLELDGRRITQSMAISRFLANEFNLFGDSNYERLRIDEVVELVEDFRKGFVNYYREADPSKKVKSLISINMPFLGIFSKILSGNSSGYLVGNKISLGDLALFDVMEFPLDQCETTLDKYQKLREHRNLVQSHQSLQKYLEQRPKTEI